MDANHCMAMMEPRGGDRAYLDQCEVDVQRHLPQYAPHLQHLEDRLAVTIEHSERNQAVLHINLDKFANDTADLRRSEAIL